MDPSRAAAAPGAAAAAARHHALRREPSYLIIGQNSLFHALGKIYVHGFYEMWALLILDLQPSSAVSCVLQAVLHAHTSFFAR